MRKRTDFIGFNWKKPVFKKGDKLFLSVLREGIKLSKREYQSYVLLTSKEQNKATSRAIDILLSLEEPWRTINGARYCQDISDYELEIKKVIHKETSPEWGKKISLKKTKKESVK